MPRNGILLQLEMSMLWQRALRHSRFHIAALAPAFAACLIATIGIGGPALMAQGQTAAAPIISRDVSKLPAEVQRMRQAILVAATSGSIEELRVPIEMNEIHPVFAEERIGDPIGYLKSKSADGNGREILAILYNLLTTGYAVQNAGTKDEMVVWPYHAVIPLSQLTPSQEVEIYRFLPPARLKDMIAQGRYSYYSIGIGHDGVWHYFLAK